VANWYVCWLFGIFSRFGMLKKEKSGITECEVKTNKNSDPQPVGTGKQKNIYGFHFDTFR
jgi:hypothetical protein